MSNGDYSVVEGSRWMGLVAKCPCVLCIRMGMGETPALVHHMKMGTGASDRASDFLTIALCPRHHDGHANSFHVLREDQFYLMYGCREVDLLADTIAAVLALLHNAGHHAHRYLK